MKLLTKLALSTGLLSSVLLSGVLQAEETIVEQTVEQDAIEEIRYKSVMEDRLHRDIQAYLGHDRFIIYVDAKLEKIRTMSNKTFDAVAPVGDIPSDSLPSMPISSALPMESAKSADAPAPAEDILPGLPTGDFALTIENGAEISELKQRIELLKNDRQQALDYATTIKNSVNQKASAPVQEQTQTQTLLGYRNKVSELVITVMLGTALEDQQIEFIRNLITRQANVDEVRGDTVKIIRSEFNNVIAKVKPSWWTLYQDAILLACLGLGLLLIIVAMYMFNRRLVDSMQQSRSDSSDIPTLTPSQVIPNNNSEKQTSLNEVKQSLVTLGLGQPQVFQQVIAGKIASGDVLAVSALFDVLGEALFRSLYPELTHSQRELIIDQPKLQLSDDKQKSSMLEMLLKELLKASGEAGSQQKPFAFLEKLNDSQVMYLLKEEDTRIKALVLSQVSSTRAAKLIQLLSSDEQTAVAYELGEFESLPVSTFRDVANRLAKKSLTVPSFKNISANGLVVLINMLDTMSSSDEAKLLNSLQIDKPETYYRLRQVYYTFPDLERTPELTISNELRDIDRTTMALALCHVSLEFKRYVLAGLPQKLRSAVIAELKVQEEESTQEQVEQARNEVVAKMRTVLKAGRFSMEDLTSLEPQF